MASKYTEVLGKVRIGRSTITTTYRCDDTGATYETTVVGGCGDAIAEQYPSFAHAKLGHDRICSLVQFMTTYHRAKSIYSMLRGLTFPLIFGGATRFFWEAFAGGALSTLVLCFFSVSTGVIAIYIINAQVRRLNGLWEDHVKRNA